jgi:hypothetical protein
VTRLAQILLLAVVNTALAAEPAMFRADPHHSRKVAWTFVTDGAQRNGPAYTNVDGTPDYHQAFSDFFYDDMVVGVDRMMSVGAVLSHAGNRSRSS